MAEGIKQVFSQFRVVAPRPQVKNAEVLGKDHSLAAGNAFNDLIQVLSGAPIIHARDNGSLRVPVPSRAAEKWSSR